MTYTTRLKFGEGGTTVFISFADGSRSAVFNSKDEVLAVLPGLLSLGKITQKEASRFARDVFKAINLPDNIKKEEPEQMGFGDLFEFLGILDLALGGFPTGRGHRGGDFFADMSAFGGRERGGGGFVMFEVVEIQIPHPGMKNLKKIFPELGPDNHLLQPTFRMHPDDDKSGMICFHSDAERPVFSRLIKSKEDARKYIPIYRQKGFTLSEEHEKALLEQINASPLP